MPNHLLSFFPVALLFLFLAGCCQKQLPPLAFTKEPPEVQPQSTSQDLPVQKVNTAENSHPVGFEEKWADFRRRTRYSSRRELVFYAQELFDLAPPTAHKKRLELSFFLMQAYKERGTKNRAEEYGAHYRRILKAMTGGSGFQDHSAARNAAGAWGKVWGNED